MPCRPVLLRLRAVMPFHNIPSPLIEVLQHAIVYISRKWSGNTIFPFGSTNWSRAVCRQALVREVTGSNPGTSKILGGDGLPYRPGDGLPGTADRNRPIRFEIRRIEPVTP